MHRSRFACFAIAVAAGLVLWPAVSETSGATRGRDPRRRPPAAPKPAAPKPAAPKQEEIPEIDPALLGEDEGVIKRKTCVSIKEQAFLVNERTTYRGRVPVSYTHLTLPTN